MLEFSSINVTLVVVDPASIPKNTFPLSSLISFLCTEFFSCRCMNFLSSYSFSNSGLRVSDSLKDETSTFFILFLSSKN